MTRPIRYVPENDFRTSDVNGFDVFSKPVFGFKTFNSDYLIESSFKEKTIPTYVVVGICAITILGAIFFPVQTFVFVVLLALIVS